MIIKNKYDVLVIGSGPAGLTAGIYVARSKYKVCVLGGNIPLGQLMNTTDVENYPGFPNGISGSQLMNNMCQQYQNLGAEFKAIQAIKCTKNEHGTFEVHTSDDDKYACDALIVATGSQPKWLNIPSEAQFKGKGISTCATCDGFFYKKKEVAVIGGGDTAMEEAMYLSGIAQKVYLIHRRDTFRASKIMQDKVLSKKNVEVIFNHIVEEFVSSDTDNMITIKIKDTKNIDSNSIMDVTVSGVFVAIGHEPQSDIIKDMVSTYHNGYVSSVNVRGVFVCGDVADHEYRQAITAAGKGCEAALDAIRFLDHR